MSRSATGEPTGAAAGSGVLAARPHAVPRRVQLRDINFGCPWPVRDNEHLEGARAHALRWMVELGISGDAAANEDRYRRWKLGEYAGWFYPGTDAPRAGGGRVPDGWYFSPFDDQFDGELGRDPKRAVELIGFMTSVLDVQGGTAPDGSLPVVRGFAGLCSAPDDPAVQHGAGRVGEPALHRGRVGELPGRR